MTPSRKIFPLVYLLLGLLLAWAMHRWFPVVSYLAGDLRLLSIVPGALGVMMSVVSAAAFLKADTGLLPFDEARTLVSGGFFKLTRNPMYLGMALVLLGVSFALGTLGSLLPVPLFVAVIHYRFIIDEERFMEAAFGDEYRAYRKKVRRWL